ncbi:MAG: hypothetical protein LBO82_06690, partial [Synergistaceae bacterium]|nr:hypothetical protein [Synergistaceae bacterium]
MKWSINMKVFRRFLRGAAALAVVLAAGSSLGAAAADDPLRGNYSIILKDRVILTKDVTSGTDTSTHYSLTDTNAAPVAA